MKLFRARKHTFLLHCFLVLSVAQGLAFDNYPARGVQTGQTYIITYSPKDDTPTVLTAFRGSGPNLATVAAVGTATGGSFTWVVAKDLPIAPDYVLEIRQNTASNFGSQFALTNGPSNTSLAASSSTQSSAAASTFSPPTGASTAPSGQKSDPSTGTKAGIGVGIGVGSGLSVAGFLLVLAVLLLRKSGQKKSERIDDTESEHYYGKSELEGYGKAEMEGISTLHQDIIAEMDTEQGGPGSGACRGPMAGSSELPGQVGHVGTAHIELDAEPHRQELDSGSEKRVSYHELGDGKDLSKDSHFSQLRDA